MGRIRRRCEGGPAELHTEGGEGDSETRGVAGEPAHVAKYAFQLAQTFNNFYHQYPVLAEPDRERKVFLLWMTDFFRAQLERTLAILGIAVPAYM